MAEENPLFKTSLDTIETQFQNIQTYIHVYAHTHVYAHMCIYIHVYTHMHIYAHIQNIHKVSSYVQESLNIPLRMQEIFLLLS